MNKKTTSRVITLLICLTLTSSCTSGDNSPSKTNDKHDNQPINIENIFLGTDNISMYSFDDDELLITQSGKILKVRENNGAHITFTPSIFDYETIHFYDESEYLRDENDAFYFNVRDIHNPKFEVSLQVEVSYLWSLGFVSNYQIRGIYDDTKDVHIIFSGFSRAPIESDGLQILGSSADLSMNLETSETSLMATDTLDYKLLTRVKVNDPLPNINPRLYALFPELQSQKGSIDSSDSIILYFDSSISDEDIQEMLNEDDSSISKTTAIEDHYQNTLGGY